MGRRLESLRTLRNTPERYGVSEIPCIPFHGTNAAGVYACAEGRLARFRRYLLPRPKIWPGRQAYLMPFALAIYEHFEVLGKRGFELTSSVFQEVIGEFNGMVRRLPL